MKKLFLSIAFAASLLIGPVVVLTQGCTQTQQKTSLNTLMSVNVGATSAYAGYLTLVLDHQVKTNGVPTVTRAYRDFQAAYNLGLVAVQFNTNAIASPAVIDASADLLTTIERAKR